MPGRSRPSTSDSLLRASETLTSELVLDRLLQKLMPICIEAAAAERAVLVLEEKGPVVRAVASADGEVAVQRTPLAERLRSVERHRAGAAHRC